MSRLRTLLGRLSINVDHLVDFQHKPTRTISARVTCVVILVALHSSLSCSRPGSNANSGKSGANISKTNASPQRNPITLPAPTKEFVTGTWQRIDAAPGDWVFEFRADGTVTFSLNLYSTDKLNRYEGTYFYSAGTETMSSVGWATFKTLDGEPLEKPVGYDVKLSETGELLISSIEAGDRRPHWDNYKRMPF